jgi:hypothetical protein
LGNPDIAKKSQLKQITIEIESLDKEMKEIARESGERIDAVQKGKY